jgi:hypothetical protein
MRKKNVFFFRASPPELRPLINIVFSPVFMQLSIYILIASAFFYKSKGSA